MHRVALLVAMVLLTLPSLVRAEVKLPAVIADNMVIQAEKPVTIWGSASPGESVRVTFGANSASDVASENGKWKITLPAVKASATPAEMTVAGSNTLTVKNILVGTVWVCSGQSNMNFRLSGAKGAQTEITKATDTSLRFFKVAENTSPDESADVAGAWIECSPQSASTFSAVAYFFGRDLRRTTGMPVGLIQSSMGATPAQAWISDRGLSTTPIGTFYAKKATQTIAEFRQKDMTAARAEYARALAEFDAAHRKWEVDMKANPSLPEPEEPPSPDLNRRTPTVLFNGMIAPIIPFTIEGVIWYQGESNSNHADQYPALMQSLIADWRERWGLEKMPFLFVQLPGYSERYSKPTEHDWALVREAQTKTLATANTAMVVTIDLGDAANIHPSNKAEVGRRLALSAQKLAFGKTVVASGPLFSSAKIEGVKIRVNFTELGGGLSLGLIAPEHEKDSPRTSDELVGFAIAGADGKYVWAKASIDGDSVLVWSDLIANPVAVRYGWAGNPACNLYNKAGLPASPFRSDESR